MSDYSTFSAGSSDALADLSFGPIMAGGPTEKSVPATLDYIVNNLRTMIGASDEYIAGYLSVVFGRNADSIDLGSGLYDAREGDEDSFSNLGL